MNEPEPPDEDAEEDAGIETRPTEGSGSHVPADERMLAPGDSDLADAWWAW